MSVACAVFVAFHGDLVAIALAAPLSEVRRVFLKHLYSAHGSDGLEYEVHVYVERNHSGSPQQLPFEHISKVCLADGSELRVLGHAHYLVVASGVHLHATDRDAV